MEKVMRTVPAAVYGGHAGSPLCRNCMPCAGGWEVEAAHCTHCDLISQIAKKVLTRIIGKANHIACAGKVATGIQISSMLLKAFARPRLVICASRCSEMAKKR